MLLQYQCRVIKFYLINVLYYVKHTQKAGFFIVAFFTISVMVASFRLDYIRAPVNAPLPAALP